MQDDFKGFLLSERKNIRSGVVEYLQTKFTEGCVVVFVESSADDKRFYLGFVHGYTSVDDIYFIECGNKEGVLRTAEILENREKPAGVRALYYLCDCDFDPFIGVEPKKGVFYTDFYSVENYLIDRDYFQHVLFSHCGVTRKKMALTLADRFWNLIREQAAALRRPFALMSYARLIGADIDLNRFVINRVVRADLDETGAITIQPQFDLAEFFSVDWLEDEKVKEIDAHMAVSDFRCWFRGKQCWQFVRMIAGMFFQDPSISSKFSDKIGKNGLAECFFSGQQIERLHGYLVGRLEPVRGE